MTSSEFSITDVFPMRKRRAVGLGLTGRPKKDPNLNNEQAKPEACVVKTPVTKSSSTVTSLRKKNLKSPLDATGKHWKTPTRLNFSQNALGRLRRTPQRLAAWGSLSPCDSGPEIIWDNACHSPTLALNQGRLRGHVSSKATSDQLTSIIKKLSKDNKKSVAKLETNLFNAWMKKDDTEKSSKRLVGKGCMKKRSFLSKSKAIDSQRITRKRSRAASTTAVKIQEELSNFIKDINEKDVQEDGKSIEFDVAYENNQEQNKDCSHDEQLSNRLFEEENLDDLDCDALFELDDAALALSEQCKEPSVERRMIISNVNEVKVIFREKSSKNRTQAKSFPEVLSQNINKSYEKDEKKYGKSDEVTLDANIVFDNNDFLFSATGEGLEGPESKSKGENIANMCEMDEFDCIDFEGDLKLIGAENQSKSSKIFESKKEVQLQNGVDTIRRRNNNKMKDEKNEPVLDIDDDFDEIDLDDCADLIDNNHIHVAVKASTNDLNISKTAARKSPILSRKMTASFGKEANSTFVSRHCKSSKMKVSQKEKTSQSTKGNENECDIELDDFDLDDEMKDKHAESISIVKNRGHLTSNIDQKNLLEEFDINFEDWENEIDDWKMEIRSMAETKGDKNEKTKEENRNEMKYTTDNKATSEQGDMSNSYRGRASETTVQNNFVRNATKTENSPLKNAGFHIEEHCDAMKVVNEVGGARFKFKSMPSIKNASSLKNHSGIQVMKGQMRCKLNEKCNMDLIGADLSIIVNEEMKQKDNEKFWDDSDYSVNKTFLPFTSTQKIPTLTNDANEKTKTYTKEEIERKKAEAKKRLKQRQLRATQKTIDKC